MNKDVSTAIAGYCLARRAHLLLMATAMQIAGLGSSIAATLPGVFSGDAHGISIAVAADGSPLVEINSAGENCPCQGTNGVERMATTPALSIPGVLTASTNTATAIASKSAGAASSMESATVTSASLFGGMITADTIKAEAGIAATSSSLTTSSAGTMLANVVVAGHAIDPNVPENTTVALPGIGTVTLKSVTPTTSAEKASIAVSGLLITVTETNSYGLAIGTTLRVSAARAGYSRIQPAAVLRGDGLTGILTTQATGGVSDVARIGASVGLPGCEGSGGATKTRTTENLAIPGLGTALTGQVTAFAGPKGDAEVAKTTSTVSDVSLLNGLVTADSLNAVAQESRTGDVSTSSTTGSGFTNLKIAGTKVLPSVKPNTVVPLVGLGSVTINQQVSQPTFGSITVNELVVDITKTNLLGIPVGTRLKLGIAQAIAQR